MSIDRLCDKLKALCRLAPMLCLEPRAAVAVHSVMKGVKREPVGLNSLLHHVSSKALTQVSGFIASTSAH